MAVTFARAAAVYWLSLYPRTRIELWRWRRRALRVPDRELRAVALAALAKRGNMEGAAAVALTARRRPRALVLALVRYQALYNYLDMLAEQASADPAGNARQLHEALVAALDADAPAVDFYALHPRGEDGGYLHAMVHACRAAVDALPAYASVAPRARDLAKLTLSYQCLIAGERESLERWARALLGKRCALRWWETAAAAGSSLGVLALIALAADPSPGAATLDALEDVYFPWVGALHSLLDSVVDRDEDAAGGQLNLAGCYGSPAEAATRLRLLAAAARARASALPGADKHELLVAAMVCHYLVELEHSALTAGVYEALGGLARPARTLVRAHGVLRRFSTGRAGGAPGGRSAPAVTPACEFEVVRVRALEQRSDARAA